MKAYLSLILLLGLTASATLRAQDKQKSTIQNCADEAPVFVDGLDVPACDYYHVAVKGPVKSRYPERWLECENGSCGSEGTGVERWTLEGAHGSASGKDEATSNLDVKRFGSKGVLIIRSFGNEQAGLQAIYKGKLESRELKGTVVWFWPGRWNGQRVKGWWSATAEQ
jgi:hypothetical protein